MSENILFINETEAARRFSVSVAWFQRGRWAGDGPPFAKIGRAVRYRVSDLEEFFEARKQRSTSRSAP